MPNPSSPRVSITTLMPDRVEPNWEGQVKIYGEGFDRGSYPMFDARIPRKEVVSDKLIHAHVTAEITGSAGTRTVKVHTSAGDLSNSLDFLVE